MFPSKHKWRFSLLSLNSKLRCKRSASKLAHFRSYWLSSARRCFAVLYLPCYWFSIRDYPRESYYCISLLYPCYTFVKFYHHLIFLVFYMLLCLCNVHFYFIDFAISYVAESVKYILISISMIYKKSVQIYCWTKKIVVYLRSQFHAKGVCTSSGGVVDIFKRRLLTLRSDVQKSRKFQKYPRNSATIDVLRDIDCSFVPLMVRPLRIYLCIPSYLNYLARRVFIFGVGFALSF